MYASAQAQPCASNYNLCTNPLVQIMPTNLVNFYFPIGDRTISSAILSSSEPYNIYVMFQISALTSTGQTVVANLFARAPLHPDYVITSCESISSTASLLASTKVDVSVGFVGTQDAWDKSMVIYRVGRKAHQSCLHSCAPTSAADAALFPSIHEIRSLIACFFSL